MKIYPAIDLRAGQVVRLYKGRFDQETVYDHDPASVARRFAAEGARRLHVVDLDGAKRGRSAQLEVVRALAEVGLPIQVGGGIRGVEDAARLFTHGASAVIIGSLAVADERATRALFDRHGVERVVLALDCRLDVDRVPRVLTRGWQDQATLSLADVIARYADLGRLQILCTDIERDGTLEGPNVALYQGLLETFPELDLIASGGVRDPSQLQALDKLGCAGVIVGRALYEGTLGLAQALEFEEARC